MSRTINLFFYDTETTGFNHTTKPHGHPDQPHLLQGGFVLDEYDLDTKEVKNIMQVNTIINWPTCGAIPSGASDIHGLTIEHVQKWGMSPRAAMSLFLQALDKAHVRVGHNEQYDFEVVQTACVRVANDPNDPFDFFMKAKALMEHQQFFCTMKFLTDILKIPSGRGGFKWPKLQEAHQHAFGERFEGAHDAFADILATRRVFYWIDKNYEIAGLRPAA